jgi:hypothetical protein
LILYLLLSSKSCDSNEQNSARRDKNKAEQSRDSITSVFGSEKLDQPELKAFEVTARLKLNDLADYLKILNDSAADQAFKQKAGEMASSLFIPGKTVPSGLLGIVFDSIRVTRSLERLNDSIYSGVLSFTFRLPASAGKSRPSSGACSKVVDIFALKQEKVFGKDTIRVWNVLLGDIR